MLSLKIRKLLNVDYAQGFRFSSVLGLHHEKSQTMTFRPRRQGTVNLFGISTRIQNIVVPDKQRRWILLAEEGGNQN